MTTVNALDPAPVRRRAGKARTPRVAAIVIGVVIAAAVIFAVIHIVTQHPGPANDAGRASFERGGGSSSPSQVQAPPAVTPEAAARSQANLAALQRAANAPGLAASHVQVATVSPPGGRPPSGAGVTNSSVGPASG